MSKNKNRYETRLRTKKALGSCLLIVGLLFEFRWSAAGSSSLSAQTNEETLVRQLVTAFNGRNISGMLALMDENVEWLTVEGSKVRMETSGKQALRDRMASYFVTCKSCKSSLDWIRKTGTRVLALERATWSTKTGFKSHASLSVYEFKNSKILRVYYFPSDSRSHESDELPDAKTLESFFTAGGRAEDYRHGIYNLRNPKHEDRKKGEHPGFRSSTGISVQPFSPHLSFRRRPGY